MMAVSSQAPNVANLAAARAARAGTDEAEAMAALYRRFVVRLSEALAEREARKPPP